MFNPSNFIQVERSHIELDSIPDKRCVYSECNGILMEKFFIEDFRTGQDPDKQHPARIDRIAGYKCPHCGVEELSGEALEDFFRQSYLLAIAAGYEQEAESFLQAAEFEVSMRAAH